MDVLWPRLLLLLGLIPLLIALYIWMLRRRRRFAVRYSSLALVREALSPYSRWRRHLPFALFLLALATLVIALARPITWVSVPAGRATIILTMDVSRSMCSTDILPNRLTAAKEAALSFIDRQESSTQIGIVAFAGFAELIQPPTTDQELLQDAIENLTTARRTAVGSAILKSLETIAEMNSDVAPVADSEVAEIEPTPVPKGVYMPDIIVLLTDGATNQGPRPVEVAEEAVKRGIRIYTIGFGTANGSNMDCGAGLPGVDPMGGGFGGGFGGGGGGFRRGIDEESLKEIADMTGGTYYSAESAGELQEVFEDLPTYLITRQEITEISVAFAAIGALLASLATILSLLWNPLP